MDVVVKLGCCLWSCMVLQEATCTSSEGFEIGICKDESHPGKDLAVEKLQFCML